MKLFLKRNLIFVPQKHERNRKRRFRREKRQPAVACSKLTIKTPERRYWRRSGVFNVNFKHF